MVAKLSVRNPAKGPKPNIATNRMAMMISCNARDMVMIARHNR